MKLAIVLAMLACVSGDVEDVGEPPPLYTPSFTGHIDEQGTEWWMLRVGQADELLTGLEAARAWEARAAAALEKCGGQ